jgi:hypothetical protein
MPHRPFTREIQVRFFAPEPALKPKNWFPFVRREVSGVRFLKLKVTV